MGKGFQPTRIAVQTLRALSWLLVLSALTAFAVVSPTKAGLEVGKTVNVVNQVYAKTLSRRLNLGDGVVFRETVSTREKSAVDIRMIDDSTLIMGELSEMILDRMVYNPNRGIVEGAMEVVQGVFRFSTSDVKMDFRIGTPVATIGIRGTEFDVLSKSTSTEIAVHKGAVEVTSAAGTVSVEPGQVYNVSPDGIGFRSHNSPEMQQAVTTMLALLAERGEDGGRSASQAMAETAELSPVIQGGVRKIQEHLVYMVLATGRIVIELWPDLAPVNVKRFKQLVRQRFYDGLNFHYVRPGYVAETGDPTGTGQGGSGQKLPDEISNQPFERGVIGMTRKKGEANSADSQFFIALGRAPNLDSKYTVIGQVIEGMHLLDQLQPGSPPKRPDKIITLWVAAEVGN